MNPIRKIALSIGLIIGFSALVFIWNPDRAESESSKQYLWTTKTHNAANQDIVVYGDSRVYRGFSTEAFLNERELNCHNFGYSSASFSKGMLDFCSQQFKSKKSGTYVFGITTHAFTKSALKDEHFKQEKDRSNFEVKTRLLKNQVLKHFDPISASDFLGLSEEMETFHSDGWVSKSNVEFDTLSGLESYTKTLSKTEIDSATYENFFVFVQNEVKQGRKFFAYRPPTMISMDELEENLTSFRFNDFILKFEKAGGTWINVPRTGYESYDGSHLTTASTIKLSEFLGDQIFNN